MGSLFQKECHVVPISSPGRVGAPNFYSKDGIGGPDGNGKPREEKSMKGTIHFHLILSSEVLCLRKSNKLNLTAAFCQHCHHVDRQRIDSYTASLTLRKIGFIMGLNQIKSFRKCITTIFWCLWPDYILMCFDV